MHKKLLHKYLLISLLFLFVKQLNAQRCEWLNGYPNFRNLGKNINDIAVDNNNDIIVCGRYNDTPTVGNYKLPFSFGNSSRSPLLIKFDEDGNIKWVFTAGKANGFGNAQFNSVVVDDSNNIYVSGTAINFDFGNNVSVKGQLYSTHNIINFILIKFDSKGVAQWVKVVGGSGHEGIIKIDADNNLYWTFNFTDKITINYGSSQTLTSNGQHDIIVLKFTNTGELVLAKNYGGADNDDIIDIGIDNTCNLYLLNRFYQTTEFMGKSYNVNFYSWQYSDLIFKIDSSGHPLRAQYIGTDVPLYDLSIEVLPNGNIVVLIPFDDTVTLGNNIGIGDKGLSKFSQRNIGIAYYDSTFSLKWVRQNYIAKSGVGTASFSFLINNGIKSVNNNIYLSGSIGYGDGKLGDIVLKIPNHGGYPFVFIAKMDTLGNFLWGFANPDTNSISDASALGLDNEGSVLLGGWFYKSISFFNKNINDNSAPLRRSVFITKIQDYSIYRGFVKSGPYCAGDTINIPYTKFGEYNDSNEFIAQLSDSAGNFETGYRELGRIKDTSSGVIKGLLPLFDVATSKNYRIRILSTDPVVQSYYKIDTLRLLIFSKDTANAGSDTLICKREKIKLTTKGGSKWLWSPTSTILNKDSTNRHIWVQPDSTTEYRIIISDSSGCGVTDTDFVKINVRPDISTKIIGDSVICKGYEQQLTAVATGGYSTKYWYIWKDADYGLIYSRTNLLYSKKRYTINYLIIVGDSCSDKIDTAYFTVKVVTNLKAHPSPDTTICKGKTAQLSVIGTGCNPDKYTYEWIEKGNTTVLSTNDSLLVNPLTTTQYQVILKDTSTLLIDTATITVTVDSIFNISTLPDSTICLGQTIDLTANVFSCDTSNMVYSWDNGLGTGKAKTISPKATTTYTIIGENTFNGLKDTAQVTITVRPKLTLTLNADSTICIGEAAELRATSSGGRPNTHNILWSAVGSQWSVNTPKAIVTPTTTTTYKAILSDGCTVNNDSAEITITVRPKLTLTLNTDSTICIGEQAELRATAKGGLESSHIIQWEYQGQQLSNNPKLTVSPTKTSTYTAILTDGCTTPNDSAEITITVRPKLTLTLNADSTICTGEQAELRATAKGGLESKHNILWTAVGSQWTVNTKKATVSPTQTTTYKTLLSDGCTDQNDSAEITITVRPPLQLTTQAKDSICSNETLLLTATPNGGLVNNYNIQWTTDNSLWTSQQNPATDTPKINTKYIATLTDNCSPPVYDTLQVIVLPIPSADFTATPTFGCPPLKVTLQDQSTANDITQNTWTIGTAEYQSTATQKHEILKQGVYNIKLNVKNQLGCSDEKIQQNAITVFAKPKANFIIKPDIKEVEEALQLYNLSQNYTSVIWDMGDGNTLSPQYGKDTSYKYHEDDTGQRTVQLIAINNQGCSDTSKQNILLYNKVHCTIPTAFTPNGDGLNNTFKPECVGVANYTLTIYNRWGQVIFNQEHGEWDGNYADNPSPSGVYMYKIQINVQSQKKKLTYGTVQVIR